MQNLRNMLCWSSLMLLVLTMTNEVVRGDDGNVESPSLETPALEVFTLEIPSLDDKQHLKRDAEHDIGSIDYIQTGVNQTVAKNVQQGNNSRSPDYGRSCRPYHYGHTGLWGKIFGRGLRNSARSSSRQRGGLPAGRRYLGGRYFGNFNNRFYGPQYGNF